MRNHDAIILKLDEGFGRNYFSELKKNLGGEINNNTYSLKEPGTDITIKSYIILPEFEILLTNSICRNTIIVNRQSDNNPDFFHFYLMKEGKVNHDYSDQKQFMEAGTPKGAFIYNGLFKISTSYPANYALRSVAFKISKKAINQFIPEATPIFNKLFSTDDPMAYHTGLTSEMENLITDVFHYDEVNFGKVPLTISRCFELFTLYLGNLKNKIESDDLKGLHVDDFNRLLKIKENLLSSFNQIIIIKDIAAEFGISESKLKRDFKILFDTSIYKFFNQAKMDEAYRMLKTGNYSVKDVGYNLGYQNISKFSEMFKKIKGINPTEVISV